MERPHLFIEKMMPVLILNEQVYYEHGGNPFKGLHRWYSRKPLSFSRASVLASLLPASVTMEEFLYLLGVYEAEEVGFFGDGEQRRKSEVRLYKKAPGSERIKRVHELCEGVWGEGVPVVLDGFAGGGSIPFESARYGLRVFGSDLNPVAVVTMKAAMEYPLRFGPDLQGDIDRWVKWVGDEAEKRLGEFFPVGEGEVVQNYLWAHTVECPGCESTVPLSPNWWLSKTSNYAGKGQERKVTSDWYAVKPVPNLEAKRVDFELIQGPKGKGTTIQTEAGDFDPGDYSTIGRGVGKCPNCGNVIENEYIDKCLLEKKYTHELYAVAYKKGQGSLEFRLAQKNDLDAINKAEAALLRYFENNLVPLEKFLEGQDTRCYNRGVRFWHEMFNPRQLLTLVTYVEIINEAKAQIQEACETEKQAKLATVQNNPNAITELEEHYQKKVEALSTYLALVLDRCVDRNCRLGRWHPSRSIFEAASGQHALNLMWNYPEVNGSIILWQDSQKDVADIYGNLCNLFGTKPHSTGIPGIEKHDPKTIQIDSASADSLFHIEDQSVDAIITDPPYYGTIQYAELSDFFYCLSPDTLIITKRGYISICDVTNNDFVLDLNGKWTAVKTVGFRDYSDHIFEIQVAYNGQKLVITPGHKIWSLKKEKASELAGEWLDSSQLKKGDYVFLPTLKTSKNQDSYTLNLSDYIDYFVDEDWLYYGKKSQEIITIQKEIQKLGTQYKTLKEIAIRLNVHYQRVVRINGEEKCEHFRIKNKIKIDYELMKVFGYFLAEGSILKRKSQRQEGRLSFVFHEKEENYVNEIIETIWEKFNCQGHIQRRVKEKAIILNFYCEPLADFFGKVLGEKFTEKKVADWILELPQSLLSGLLAGYWNGDGSKGTDFFQATTVSKNLACQIRLILQQHGIISHLYFDNQTRKAYFHNKEIISQPRFLIKAWGKYKEKLANILNVALPPVKKGNYLNLWTTEGQWLPIRNIKTSIYTGKVYNFTTESHNYVTAQCCVHNCWQKRTLGDIFPELFLNELTDKDREAVANPSRFRNMGTNPDDLANQDYEAKMQMAFQEYHRVLRDDGVMTVHFNHKESGAWDTLTTSLVNAGFEITASWAVNTENPQNLHQAKKNSVSSTILLICRKRDPNAGQAWWDDLRPELANLVEKRAPEFEANNITGINLYLSAFGPALNIFTRQHPILNSNGQEVRPEQAFAAARIAIANYRFRKLVQTETTGFDPLTQWYLLAWDAFNAREFPFDEARQLALAIGGLNITELAKTHKLIDSTSGTCKLLTPQQRLKKRAFTLNDQEFNTNHSLIDGLHAILALYAEEQTLPPIRRFLKNTNLNTNDLFMKTLEIAFKVLPQNTPEYQTLLNLWLNIDELKTQVIVEQLQINYPPEGQLNLFNQP